MSNIFYCKKTRKNYELPEENMAKFVYSWYQDEGPLKFNEELINYKGKENVLVFVDAIGKGLEIIPSIFYKGSHIESIRKVYKRTETVKEIEIKKSYLQKIIMNFTIKREDEEKDVKLSLYFPILIDNKFFLINGNYFAPIFQLVDSGTYRTNKVLVLKNLIMPLVIEGKKIILFDINNEEHKGKRYIMNLFRGKVNLFVYYFAKFGFLETLQYFDMYDYVFPIDLTEEEFLIDNEDYYHFKINNSFGFTVDKNWYEENPNHKNLLLTLVSLFNSRSKFENIIKDEFWVRQLGSNFTKNNSSQVIYEKGLNILVSFERSLDSITKMILRVPEEDKEDTYSIVRYMACHYAELSKFDNMDLSNKRLRDYEQLFYPFIKKLSKGIYRLLNKRNPTLKELSSIFNVDSGYLINTLIKTETIRYVNSVNSYDLFSVSLKATLGGLFVVKLWASQYNKNLSFCWNILRAS